MDFASLQWLNWIASGVGFVLALVFGSKLVETALKRVYAKRDARDQLHETNDGKRIDADQEALKMFKDRLEAVENELKEIRKDHNSLMVENEGLRKDAAHNEKELVKQADEIKSLRERNHKLSNEIQQRDAKIGELERKHDREVSDLRAQVTLLKGEIERLSALEAKTHDTR